MTVQGIPSFRHNDAAPVPSSVVVHQASGALELVYPDGRAFRLPFELLRVHSPSAEVLGHGPGQEVLQVGKKHVGIASLAPVGQYAVQPRFSDGHDTGLYSWSYLYWLAENQEVLWNHYLEKLAAAGGSREG